MLSKSGRSLRIKREYISAVVQNIAEISESFFGLAPDMGRESRGAAELEGTILQRPGGDKMR